MRRSVVARARRKRGREAPRTNGAEGSTARARTLPCLRNAAMASLTARNIAAKAATTAARCEARGERSRATRPGAREAPRRKGGESEKKKKKASNPPATRTRILDLGGVIFRVRFRGSVRFRGERGPSPFVRHLAHRRGRSARRLRSLNCVITKMYKCMSKI